MSVDTLLRQGLLLYQIEKLLMKELGIDLEDLRIIMQIYSSENMKIGLQELIPKISSKGGTLNQKIKTLCTKSIITKKRDPNDERKVILTIEEFQVKNIKLLIESVENIIQKSK
ncbi:transcriptional regulator, SarA/Rot family (plasmid) [Mammaliicoccus sciuri]|uniref:transcriptional regulator, SarA/Rot family n=1 Tax=Mammaliicoccus sciuri TaxID=1296 RepID=UPI002DBABE76|nr:MarR family transcriptional regulator [Mammaliicoccus sciuri]MEB5648575.1 MarR family transcriptional regulator [Mammaliicoccus sciuri]